MCKFCVKQFALIFSDTENSNLSPNYPNQFIYSSPSYFKKLFLRRTTKKCQGSLCDNNPLLQHNNRLHCIICEGEGDGYDGHYKTSVVEKVKDKDDGWGVREIGRRMLRGWEMTETTCKKCPLHLILEPISLRSDDIPSVRHCVTCGPDEGDSAKYDLNFKVVEIKQKLEEEKMKTAASETARLEAEEKSCNVIKTIQEEKNKAEMKKAEEKKHPSQALQLAQQGNYFDTGNGLRADIVANVREEVKRTLYPPLLPNMHYTYNSNPNDISHTHHSLPSPLNNSHHSLGTMRSEIERSMERRELDELKREKQNNLLKEQFSRIAFENEYLEEKRKKMERRRFIEDEELRKIEMEKKQLDEAKIIKDKIRHEEIMIAKEKNQFNDAMSVLAEENQKRERLREEIAMQESELADANSAFVDETRMATENRLFQRGVPNQEMQKNYYSSQRSNQNSGENRSAIFDRDLSNQEKQMGNYSSHDFNELNYKYYSANDLVGMNINSGAKSVRQRSMTSNSVSPIMCSGRKKDSIPKAPDSVTSLSRQVFHKNNVCSYNERSDIDTYVSSDEGTRNGCSVLTESSRIVFGSVVEHLESAKDKLNSSDSIQDQLEMATLIEKLASAAAAIKRIDN